MKKHDYEKLAEAVREHTTPLIPNALLFKDSFLSDLCDILAEENPKFNRAKFLEMCR